MELRFVAPQLRKLDLVGTEALVAGVASGERPPHGVAGLVDYRLLGRISRLVADGFVTGEAGEVTLVSGHPRLPFEKVLLFGAGAPEQYGEATLASIVDHLLSTLEGLRIRTAVVELPGRHLGLVPAERAAAILLERAEGRPDHDVWTLVEPAEGQRAIGQHLLHTRRGRAG